MRADLHVVADLMRDHVGFEKSQALPEQPEARLKSRKNAVSR